MAGVPHTPGTKEYLTCEKGKLQVVVAGEVYNLEAGDVVSFRGDQNHSYHNPYGKISVGYSFIVFSM